MIRQTGPRTWRIVLIVFALLLATVLGHIVYWFPYIPLFNSSLNRAGSFVTYMTDLSTEGDTISFDYTVAILPFDDVIFERQRTVVIVQLLDRDHNPVREISDTCLPPRL
jgi:hypothetical protein